MHGGGPKVLHLADVHLDRPLIALLLRQEGFHGATRDGVSVIVPLGVPGDILGSLRNIAESPPTAIELASE